MRTIILILCVFLVSCETNKTQQIPPLYPGYEYLVYHNYSESDSIIFDKEVFEHLDKIGFNEFQNIIGQNVDISNSDKISVKRDKLFYNKNDSLIDIYLLNEINNPEMKQYLGYSRLSNFLKETEEIFIIFNVADNKIQSSFVVYSTFNSGYDSNTRMVTYKGGNNYELKVYEWSDNDGKFEHSSCFTVTEEGFIDTSVECKKGSKK